MLQNRSLHVRYVKFIKDKERLRSWSRLKEAKEAWQLNGMHDPPLDSGGWTTAKGVTVTGTGHQIWTQPACWLTAFQRHSISRIWSSYCGYVTGILLSLGYTHALVLEGVKDIDVYTLLSNGPGKIIPYQERGQMLSAMSKQRVYNLYFYYSCKVSIYVELF